MKYLLTLLMIVSCFSVFAQQSKYGEKAKLEFKEINGLFAWPKGTQISHLFL